MRVHYLSSSTIPSRAANAVHVMKICGAMVRLGHEPTLFSRLGAGPDGPLDDEEVLASYGVIEKFRLVRLNAGGWPVISSLSYALRTRRASKQMGLPDVYWGRQVQSLLAVSGFGVPVIFELHALAPNRYHRWMQRQLLARPSLSHVVVISAALRDDFLTEHPSFPGDRVVVAHDGADVVGDSPTPITPWPGRPDALQVGYTGHLYAGRGADVIVALAQRLPDVDFHLVGGTADDIAHWQDEAWAEGVANIRFHGHRPAALIPRFLVRFDVVLAPYQERVATSGGAEISRWISPMKLFEYMAAGKAIVASNLTTIEEVLVDGENAVLCRPSDTDAWEAAVRRLCTDEAFRRRLGDAARRELEHRYTWEERARSVLAATRGDDSS